MTKFKDLPDILAKNLRGVPEHAATMDEAAFSLRPKSTDVDNGLQTVICRVHGRPGKPALADLASRSVFPLKA